MAKVNIRDLRPGMKLADDVVGNNGRLLLVKGTVFDEKQLRVLNIWGVTEVDILGVDKEEVEDTVRAELDDAVLKACEEHIRKIFGTASLDNEFAAELFRISVQWYARQVQEGAKTCHQAYGSAPAASSCKTLCTDKTAPTLAQVVAKGQKVISMPTAYFRIVEALKDPYCSAGQLAGIVDKDIGLSARLLKVVNSPAYGLSKRVDSISRGITIIGFKELSELVLSVSVVGMFNSSCSDILNMQDFWKHSLACGIVARILASHRPGVSEERMFIAGMLHDIGRLSLMMTSPCSLGTAIQLARSSTFPLHEVELTQFGFTHADVGGELLSGWKLPPALVDIIRHHHTPSQANDPREASLLCVADCMATAFQYGSSGSAYIPHVDGDTWECLGMPLSVLDTVRNQSERQVSEVIRAFFE